jgi:hypothetical protein
MRAALCRAAMLSQSATCATPRHTTASRVLGQGKRHGHKHTQPRADVDQARPACQRLQAQPSSATLQVVLQDGQTFSLLAIVGHHSAAAAHHLAGGALRVQLAQARPLAELLVLRHGDEVDVVLAAQRLDELLVVRLVAVLSKDAQLSLTL